MLSVVVALVQSQNMFSFQSCFKYRRKIERWKKWLFFGFAKGRLVCRAKPNVLPKAFGMRLAKIVFKKCAVGKNKNTEALTLGSAVWWFICPVTCLCFNLSFILAVSFIRLAYNVLQVDVGGLLKHHLSKPTKGYLKIQMFFSEGKRKLKCASARLSLPERWPIPPAYVYLLCLLRNSDILQTYDKRIY